MKKKTFKVFFRSLINPIQLEIIFRDFRRILHKQNTNEIHLKACIEWLCRSQDNSGSGGCSASYGFDKGWAPPYPETTGYIISSFLEYAKIVKDVAFIERAKRMGDWEIDIQLPSGAVRGGVGINDYPVVFNTGMVILGWTDLYYDTKNSLYLKSAEKAADWLCENINKDGSWSKYSYNGVPHAYHSRVSWSLLKVYKYTNNIKYKNIAIQNVSWILNCVQDNGWIENMGFYKGDNKILTHTIAYTLRGLLECSFYFEGDFMQKIQDVVLNVSEKLLSIYQDNNTSNEVKFLPGRFNENWENVSNFSCITGNAQIAIIWLLLYKLNNDNRYLNSAVRLLEQIKQIHDITNANDGVYGGVPGSYPIWGSYMQYSYPNWGVKFFADALMILKGLK